MPNKFPAFVATGQHEVRSYYPEAGFYRAKPAVGGHDIIVIKQHDLLLPHFTQETMVELISTFQKRYLYYRANAEVEYVLAFYNHGPAAGASIDHPHAQVVASSIVPNHITKEKHGSERYFEINGQCVYCDMINHERNEKCRILAENDGFIMFTFFAARFPFEIWILPKEHQSEFEKISESLMQDLATVLRQGFSMLDQTLHNPDLNFFIHSLPTTSEDAEYYHWHIEIAPRVALYAGFELGSGTIIDVVSPEKAAEFLRDTHKED